MSPPPGADSFTLTSASPARSVSPPRQAASTRDPNGASSVPVASVAMRTSSIRAAAAASSPAKMRATIEAVSAVGSPVRAPASRTSSTSRAASSSQVSWSHSSIAAASASQSHRKPPFPSGSPSRKASRALFRRGAAALCPSAIRSARPSRSRSGALGEGEGGAARAAVATPRAAPSASGPANWTAISASRYVSRASVASSASSCLATASRSGGASVPRWDVNVISARSRLPCARCRGSSGPASALPSSASAASGSPA